MALVRLDERLEMIWKLLLGFPISIRGCLKCGSSQHIEMHHLYGRKHVLEVEVPLCQECHRGRWGIHAALSQAKVDLRHAPDENERRRRARRALLVFLWWLDEGFNECHQ